MEKTRLPSNGELVQLVRACLRRGERTVVLDLTPVSTIDAAGIGELVRAYNVAAAGNGALRIVNPSVWVRETLERVGLFDRLASTDAIAADVDRSELSACLTIGKIAVNRHPTPRCLF